jgi:hypothetical protein
MPTQTNTRRHSRQHAELVKKYAETKGISLRTAQVHRKSGHPGWLDFCSVDLTSNLVTGEIVAKVEEWGSLEQMMDRLKKTEVTASAMLRDAEQNKRVVDLNTLSRHHTESAKGVIECQAKLQKVQLEAGQMIKRDDLKRFVSSYLTPLTIELDTMARQQGPRCNHMDPELAIGVLEEWVKRVRHQISEIKAEFDE